MRYVTHNFTDPDAIRTQKKDVAVKLYELFRDGAHDINPNPALAQHYLMIANGGTPVPAPLTVPEIIATLLGIYTTPRLLAVRWDRVWGIFVSSFLPRFFGFFGLSYFLEYAIHAGINAYEAYHAISPLNGETRWQAFKRAYRNALNINPQRQYRMDNALRWGPINLISSFLGPIAFAAVNIWGFFRDVTNEVRKGDIASAMKCDKDLVEQIEALKNEKQKLEDEHILKQQENVSERLLFLREHCPSLINQQKELNSTIRPEIRRKYLREVFFVTLILVGVILYATPGLNAAAFAVGAILVLTASIYHMYNRCKQIKKFATHKEPPVPDLTENESVDNAEILKIVEKANYKAPEVIHESPSLFINTNSEESPIEPTPTLSPTNSPTSPQANINITQPSGNVPFVFPQPSSQPTPPLPSVFTPPTVLDTVTIQLLFLYYVVRKMEEAAQKMNKSNYDPALLSCITSREFEFFRIILKLKSNTALENQLFSWSNQYRKHKSTPIKKAPQPIYKENLQHTLFNKILEQGKEHQSHYKEQQSNYIADIITDIRNRNKQLVPG